MTAAQCVPLRVLRRSAMQVIAVSGILAVALTRSGAAQIMEGALRVTVRDSSGRAVAAHVELTGRNPQFRTTAEADSAGRVRLFRLPRGVYRLAVTSNRFEELVDLIEIRSALPQEKEVTLRIRTLAT